MELWVLTSFARPSLIPLQYGSAGVTFPVPCSGALAMHPRLCHMNESPYPGRIISNSVNGVPDNTCYNLESWLWSGLLWVASIYH